MPIDSDYAVLRSVLTGGRIPNVKTPAPGPDPSDYGWAVEFGVYTGYSLGIIAAHMPVIGFDSFEGLPEDWRPGFPKGKFALGDNPEGPSVQDLLLMGPNRMLVPGWFEDTVPDFPFPRLGLVHIDCDLYSSTVTALDAVAPHVGPGTIVVFDEYEGVDFDDEKRAFSEWMDRFSVGAELIAHAGEEAAFVIESIGGSL